MNYAYKIFLLLLISCTPTESFQIKDTFYYTTYNYETKSFAHERNCKRVSLSDSDRDLALGEYSSAKAKKAMTKITDETKDFVIIMWPKGTWFVGLFNNEATCRVWTKKKVI